MTDLERILNMAVRMDAHDARKARDIFDGRLRELDPEGMTPDGPVHVIDLDKLQRQRTEGAELQRGLEVAVERERERLDGPDIVAHLDNSDTTVHEGARNECPACEDEGHVGQTDDF